MNITGLTLNEFTEIAERVGRELYDGNVIVADDAHDTSNSRGGRCVARLRVADSRGNGARRSWSGRRMPAACWHAYRDVLYAVFAEHPYAKIRTGLATYDGMTGFLRDFPETGEKNIGSQMQPARMVDLCECSGSVHSRLDYVLA